VRLQRTSRAAHTGRRPGAAVSRLSYTAAARPAGTPVDVYVDEIRASAG